MPSWWKSCIRKPPPGPAEIVELDLRHSNLAAVPAEVFAHERTLEKLSLASNQITDLPPSLFHCHELRELELYDNEIRTIPSAIGTLTRLTRLDASRNAIAEVADTIKNCKSLAHLNLGLNHLVKVPEGISQLVGLEELNLTDTCLEFLSANFGRLTKLRVLELRENLLQSLPKSMTRFTHLNRLDIGHNEMREMPQVIATMTNLTELFVDNNTLVTIPKFVGNLTKLSSLDCSNNEIYEIAEDLCKCTHLTDLNLSFNSLSSLPEGLGHLEAITILRIDNNLIQYLPENIGHLKNLHEFSAMRNSLKALPPSFGLLRKLRTLLLDENLLTELPKEIGSCTQLSILHVTRNQLTTIPSEIGYLFNLKVLSISGNFLQHLPVSILNIPQLGAIWISESQSKPLLPLNKETVGTTGQVVLTCFLLPQVSVSEEVTIHEERADRPGMTRQTMIKFADFPDEANGDEVEVEQIAAPGTSTDKPQGLSRAPTPYPKELRALAKHASQIHNRHSREVNGEVVPKDLKIGDGEVVDYEVNSTTPTNVGKSFHQANGDGLTVNHETNMGRTDGVSFPFHPGMREARTATSLQYDSIRRLRSSQVDPAAATIANDIRLSSSGDHVEQSHMWNLSQHSDTTTVKTPPPYHIAARRAAFFRNSTTGSSSISGNNCLSPTMDSPNNFSFTGIQTTYKYSPPPDHPQSLLPSTPSSTRFEESAQKPEMSITHDNNNENNGLNVTFTKTDESVPRMNTTFTSMEQSHLDTTFTVPTTMFALDGARDGRLPPISSNTNMNVQSGTDIGGKCFESKGEGQLGILETLIPNDWKGLGSSADELEGGTDSSEGPPILPMRPIMRDYSQLTASSGLPTPLGSLRQRNSSGEGSRIPVSSRRSTETVRSKVSSDLPPYPPPPPLQSMATSTPDRISDLPKFVAIVGGGGQDTTDSGRSQSNFISSSSYQRMEADVNLVKHQPNTSNIPKYHSSSSFVKSSASTNSVQGITPCDLPSAVIQMPRTGIATRSDSSLPNRTDIPRRNSSERRKDTSQRIPVSVTANDPGSSTSQSLSSSRIPVMNKKPWIFGTHRNTRVVPLEYKKVSDLGFSICHAATDKGAYIDFVEDPESSVKRGDKLLEVDGIDVSKMNLEIVRKILSNCQETINFLVSREN